MSISRDKAKENSLVTLNELYQQIRDTAEEIVPINDTIEDYFFQDVDYQKIKSLIPMWMIDAGRSPESSWDKELYEKFRLVYKDPISNRIIHLADVRAIMAALQDRIIAVISHLEVIYKYLPAYCLYDDSEYESSNRGFGEEYDKIHAAINNVFVSLCSSFDLLTKVVYECSRYNASNFDNYNRLKSRKNNILYNKSYYGFEELKADGLLYCEPNCVRIACSFRDEFIHNGSWDYRCAIYCPYIEGGEPVEPFVMMPDLTDAGLLVTSGSRNMFYAKSNKLNVFLPGFIKDVMEVLTKTIKELNDVLRKKIVTKDKDKATNDAIIQLSRNLISSTKMMTGGTYTEEELEKEVNAITLR